MHLVEPKLKIFSIIFGCSDLSRRFFEPAEERRTAKAGIKNGISGTVWVSYFRPNDNTTWEPDEKFEQVRVSSSVGIDPVHYVAIEFGHADSFMRLSPALQLRDFDNSSYMPMLSRSFAEKVKCIHVYANGYKLDEIPKSSFGIDYETYDPEFPFTFSEAELADPWVRIRPSSASSFSISFSSKTPRRLYSSPKTPDSFEPK